MWFLVMSFWVLVSVAVVIMFCLIEGIVDACAQLSLELLLVVIGASIAFVGIYVML